MFSRRVDGEILTFGNTNAAASTAGVLFSSNTFEVPQFQREFSWQQDEIEDFWSDLSSNIGSASYFLGLVILTDEEDRKQVVNGQQKIVAVTLLANALFHEALRRERKALDQPTACSKNSSS